MEIEISRQSTDLAVRAQGLRVVDQQSLTLANELLLAGKGLIKVIKEKFAPLKRAQDDAKKKLLDWERDELGKVEPTVSYLDREIVSYRVEQDRIRREAEEKARRQEEEKRRLEREAIREAEEKVRKAEAEQKRINAEAQAQALAAQNRALVEKIERERQRLQAELAAKAKADQDAIIDRAAAEEEKLGPSVVVPEKIATNKTTIRHNWKFRVSDIRLVPLEYMLVNEAMIGKIGRASEGKTKIPGIDFYDDPSTATTR